VIKKILNFPHIYPVVIIFTGLISWYRTLGFWFFKAFEASWLMGSAPHTIINLIKSHSFLYYLDWKIFGWNPWGWYLTSLVLHIIASLLLFRLVLKITENRHLAFISSLIFVANTAYNDVLTWGSFNSYYPLLLIFMLLALINFINYKTRKNIKSLLLSVLFSFLAFFIRETGLVIVPIITLYDLIYSKNLFSKKTICGILKRQSLFYLSILIFFGIRSWYGGVSGDFADSNVKMRVKLMADGLYLTYFNAAFLTFGKLIPPQIIPYPILNYIRDFLSTFINKDFLNKYFFSILGWLSAVVIGRIFFLLRNKKKYIRMLMFFGGWITLFLTFVAIAIPYTEEFLARDYLFITMRYHYFAFAGASVVIACFFIIIYELLQKQTTKKISRRIIVTLVTAYMVLQVLFLYRIQSSAYASTYEEPKRFYSQFAEQFPTLSSKVVFYIYPHAVGIGDYLFEWYFTKDLKYPNLKNEPYRIESQIGAILKKMGEKKIDLRDVIFLDYTSDKQLTNRTADIVSTLTNQRSYILKPIKDSKNSYLVVIEDGPFVETPYAAEITMSVSYGQFKRGTKSNSKIFRALVDYSVDRLKYLQTAKITTANTMSQRPGEPFLHLLPDNLIDGNIGQRSSWIVDATPAWLMVDLGKERKIKAFAWGSQPGTGRVPSTYTYFTSLDGVNWSPILKISSNEKDDRLDILSTATTARYVKMDLQTTQSGGFASLDEFEVIGEDAKAVLDLYNSRDSLLMDSLDLFSFISSQEDINYAKEKGLSTYWARLSWETNKVIPGVNLQQLYFPFKVQAGSQKITVKIPEGEIFAIPGQLLEKRFTKLTIDFYNQPFNFNVASIKLIPQLPL
jgi:hypothetical protein